MRTLAVTVTWSVVLAAGCLPHHDEVDPDHSTRAGKSKRPQTKSKAPSGTKTTTPKRPSPKPAVASSAPLLREPFKDSFDRDELGDDWAPTIGVWEIRDGKLCGRRAHNHPVWLNRRLPTNARIEFDASSGSVDGDIKVELWGDGSSAATGTSYKDATSYLAVFGGWKNRFHVLARLDEHAPDRKQLVLSEKGDFRIQPVVPDRTYRMKIERSDGKTVQWQVDDTEILSYNDSDPLQGRGHEHFAFNDWETPVCFDNLTITPL